MVLALGGDREHIEKTYWRTTNGVVQMKVVDNHCIFYKDGCCVHQGRPWRCAEWPLHPSILLDENNFKAIADSCPGIKAEVGYEEFCRVLRSLMARSLPLVS